MKQKGEMQNKDLISNPDAVSMGGLEWLNDAIEFDYDSFIIKVENGQWVASHWDEDRFEEDIVLQDPKYGIEFDEPMNLFGEHVLTVEEFQLLEKQATNIIE